MNNNKKKIKQTVPHDFAVVGPNRVKTTFPNSCAALTYCLAIEGILQVRTAKGWETVPLQEAA